MNDTDQSLPEVRYGTFTHRMLASVIDLSVILMVALPLVDLVLAHFLPPVSADRLVQIAAPIYAKYQNYSPIEAVLGVLASPAFLQEVQNQRLFERMVIENLLQVFFIGLYIIPFWTRHSATPGKMLFRLEIRDATTGGPMSEKQCFGRFFSYIISLVPLTLGFAWISLNKKRRAFHDYLAGTVVVIKARKQRQKADPIVPTSPPVPAPET